MADPGRVRVQRVGDRDRRHAVSLDGGHASFFVRSDASAIDVPIRTSVAAPSDIPVTVTLTIDDRLVGRLVLNDDGWHR